MRFNLIFGIVAILLAAPVHADVVIPFGGPGTANDFHIRFFRGPGAQPIDSDPWGASTAPGGGLLTWSGTPALTPGQTLTLKGVNLARPGRNPPLLMQDAWWTLDGERIPDAPVVMADSRGRIATGAEIRDLRWGFAFVPEPGTWVMLIVGFGALGVIARRRRAVAA